jgi:hypothetical protein
MIFSVRINGDPDPDLGQTLKFEDPDPQYFTQNFFRYCTVRSIFFPIFCISI